MNLRVHHAPFGSAPRSFQAKPKTNDERCFALSSILCLLRFASLIPLRDISMKSDLNPLGSNLLGQNQKHLPLVGHVSHTYEHPSGQVSRALHCVQHTKAKILKDQMQRHLTAFGQISLKDERFKRRKILGS